jgi:hypothetical protein
MMKRNDEICLGVDRCYIGPFLQVATNATQAQVPDIVGPTVLPSNDMVDLMRENRRILRKMAVFTGVVGPLLDQLSRIARELHEAARIVQNSSA